MGNLKLNQAIESGGLMGFLIVLKFILFCYKGERMMEIVYGGNYNLVVGNEAYFVCPRCGKNSEDNPDLDWELVPTARAFASYKNPLLAKQFVGQRIFDSVCSDCFSNEDQRKLERFDSEFDLRNHSSNRRTRK